MSRLSLILLAVLTVLAINLYGANNILLIIADDYGTDGNSLYNTNASASLPPTPNINSLATNGVLFRNAYAYPTCSPSRACMLTGRYGFRTGLGVAIGDGGSDASLPASEFTLPQALDAIPQLGYRHASIGKWHLSSTAFTDPNVLGGWSHFSGAMAGDLPNYTSWVKTIDGTNFVNYTNYATSDNVDDAVAWIAAQGTNAWFLWLAFNAPHTPFHKPPNDLHSYDGLPPTVGANTRPYFEAMTEAMDTEIGRLMANISLTNTTVIFLGDNGTSEKVIQPPFSTNRAKGTLYEGGIRVPLIIAGAGVSNPGRESTAVAHCVDLYATMLELAGVNLAQTLPTNLTFDSQSLLPILTNAASIGPRIILAESFGSTTTNSDAGRTVRGERFKLIQFRTGTNEFYDLSPDPLELTNLLASALTAPQQAEYDLLTNQSAEWQARPQLLAARSFNQFLATFTPVQLYTYTLQRLDDLTMTNWFSLISTTAPSSDVNVTLTSTIASGTNRFYRIQAAMP